MKTTVRLSATPSNIVCGLRHDAIEEAAVQLVHVGADDEDKVGAVAHLGERGHDPAARLHDAEVAVLPLAERMIEDAAGTVGDGQDGAGARDVAAMPP